MTNYNSADNIFVSINFITTIRNIQMVIYRLKNCYVAEILYQRRFLLLARPAKSKHFIEDPQRLKFVTEPFDNLKS